MRSSVTAGLWILGTLLAGSACDDPAGPGSTEAFRSSSPHDGGTAAAAAGEIHQLGDFALYMPAGGAAPRAVLVALGGPNTKAIVTGEPFGAPLPQVEAALQAMGAAFREWADENRVAILGTSRSAMTALPDGAASDQLIVDAIAAGAAASGDARLSGVPLMLYGMSGGGPEASGFAARHPERVAGVFLKVPAGVAALTTDAQRQVPTFMALAEFDTFVDNAALGQAAAANRAAGALWAMATEPGVPHHAMTPAMRTVTLVWMSSVLQRRLAGSSGRVHPVPEQSGWLGNPATGEVSRWGRYEGDRSSASWLPTESAAEEWRNLMGL